MKDLLVEVSADVPAPPDVVLAKVVAVLSEAGVGTLEIDRGLVALQGGWWYRGEYLVTPTANGTRVTHRVRNVAKRGRWAVPLANRMFLGFRERTERNFAEFIASLA